MNLWIVRIVELLQQHAVGPEFTDDFLGLGNS